MNDDDNNNVKRKHLSNIREKERFSVFFSLFAVVSGMKTFSPKKNGHVNEVDERERAYASGRLHCQTQVLMRILAPK